MIFLPPRSANTHSSIVFDLIDAGARIAEQDGDGDFERSDVDALPGPDDGRDGPAAGRTLVLGASRDVHHRVADDGGDPSR